MQESNKLQKALAVYLATVKGHALPITTAVVISMLIDWIGVRILAALTIAALVIGAWKHGISICLVRNRNRNKEGERDV